MRPEAKAWTVLIDDMFVKLGSITYAVPHEVGHPKPCRRNSNGLWCWCWSREFVDRLNLIDLLW